MSRNMLSVEMILAEDGGIAFRDMVEGLGMWLCGTVLDYHVEGPGFNFRHCK
jgi:hypothetical protein